MGIHRKFGAFFIGNFEVANFLGDFFFGSIFRLLVFKSFLTENKFKISKSF